MDGIEEKILGFVFVLIGLTLFVRGLDMSIFPLDTEHGSGIALQLPVEETIGLGGQITEISQRMGDRQ